jgi:pimeloyl-ACP methyl ester carboxylesterase
MVAAPLLIAFLAWTLISPPAKAEESPLGEGPQGAPSGSRKEQTWGVPVWGPNKPELSRVLEATLYQPEGNGPFPLLLMTHGTNFNNVQDALAKDRLRRSDGVWKPTHVVDWFLKRGWAVASLMRAGYARSGGQIAGTHGCPDPNLYNYGQRNAHDVSAAFNFFKKQSFVRPDKILVLGQSTGGFTSLAVAAMNLDGVVGVINTAGVVRVIDKDGNECGIDSLKKAVTALGKMTQTPTLWLYGVNDSFMPDNRLKALYGAYSAETAVSRLYVNQHMGRADGHFVMTYADSERLWSQTVEEFLDEIERRPSPKAISVAAESFSPPAPGTRFIFCCGTAAGETFEHRVEESPSKDQYAWRAPNGTLIKSKLPVGFFANPPHPSLFPLSEGKTVKLTGTASGGQKVDEVLTVEGGEQLTTPAGTFETIRIRSVARYQGDPDRVVEQVFWYAPSLSWRVKWTFNDSKTYAYSRTLVDIIKP